jgi:hypothetical protein
LKQILNHRICVAVLSTLSISVVGWGSNGASIAVTPPSPLISFTAAPKPALAVSSEQLAKDYLANPDKADAKYKGKAIRIDGKVRKVTKDNLGVTILELKGVKGMYVSCGIPAASAPTARAKKAGQSVSVVGNCYGKLDDFVSVDSCEFIR